MREELARRDHHVTLALLWSEYKAEQPDGYQYSQFVAHYRRYERKLSVVLRQAHRAGEKVFVDFCDGLGLTDPVTGDKVSTQLFVAALGASSYTFATATLSQSLPAWLDCHVRMYACYGNVPAVTIPDNLRAGVSRPDRYEATLNPSYRELVEHYGTCGMPARVGKPRDKGKVEAAVLVEHVIMSQPHPEQGYRSALGLLRLGNKHGHVRLECACEKAWLIQSPGYRTVKTLYGMANALKERLARIDHQGLTQAEFIGLLVDDEWLYREQRKLTARLKVAKFKERNAAIENIDYRTPRGLKKTQLLELAQNRWLGAHQNVLITGPSGAGKSYLAQALGTCDRLTRRLAKLDLLILDDFGLATLTESEKQDLLEALEERYGSGATLVTSQLPVCDWHEYLGAGRLADAILDRLVHNAHRIELSSRESMRKQRPTLNHGGQSDT